MTNEQILDTHLKRWTQTKEEMIQVEKAYLDWLLLENERYREALEKLLTGIYDFTHIPLETKNFVYRIISKALGVASTERIQKHD